MPTVLRFGPYRCFFYAGDREEPPHVHVERDVNVATFWLDPRSDSSPAADTGALRSDAYRGWYRNTAKSY